MNEFWVTLTILLVLVIGWLAWRYFRLRRGLKAYAEQVEQMVKGELALSDLSSDVPGLEELSDAVYRLTKSDAEKIETGNAERARLEATLTQMTDGVLIVDSLAKIQMTNPAAEKLFGDGTGLVGKTVSVALRNHQLIETWRRCQRERQVHSESVELPANRKFLQLVAIPDAHASGEILLVQDLTRIRRLETVRRDFISNVSHELRTPLASLKALTETLQEGALDDPPAAQRFLGRIQIEVDALTQMAAELLELSRIESGQVPLDRRPISPVDLLHSAADRMNLQAQRAGIDLRVTHSESIPPINADFPRLEQVLVNLVHNAIKFTPPGGSVTLDVTQDDHQVHFSIEDTGIGIPADDLSRIFERFYRVDRSRSGGGTGLGLSIARHLVESHDGKIWAESREGEGSTFHFTIPILNY